MRASSLCRAQTGCGAGAGEIGAISCSAVIIRTFQVWLFSFVSLLKCNVSLRRHQILKTDGGMGEEAGVARISNISYGPSHVANHYKVV